MTSLADIIALSGNKTRVLIFSSNPSVAKLLLSVLHFAHKKIDYFLKSGENETSGSDFVLWETSEISEAALYQPNIVLLANDFPGENMGVMLQSIVSGGVLIYPEIFENRLEDSVNFFRKMAFSQADFQKNDKLYFLNTDLGSLPLQTSDENLITNLNGLKILSQQFGILEEAFYEPVMEF